MPPGLVSQGSARCRPPHSPARPKAWRAPAIGCGGQTNVQLAQLEIRHQVNEPTASFYQRRGSTNVENHSQ